MNKIAKLVLFNAILGVLDAIGLTLLSFYHIPFSDTAWVILDVAMPANFILALWNYKRRKGGLFGGKNK